MVSCRTDGLITWRHRAQLKSHTMVLGLGTVNSLMADDLWMTLWLFRPTYYYLIDLWGVATFESSEDYNMKIKRFLLCILLWLPIGVIEIGYCLSITHRHKRLDEVKRQHFQNSCRFSGTVSFDLSLVFLLAGNEDRLPLTRLVNLRRNEVEMISFLSAPFCKEIAMPNLHISLYLCYNLYHRL